MEILAMALSRTKSVKRRPSAKKAKKPSTRKGASSARKTVFDSFAVHVAESRGGKLLGALKKERGDGP
jgi:hypothetical protein